MNRPKSEQLFKEAKECLVGGVNSPVRSFNAVGKTPVFIKKAQGAYLYTEDNEKLIDYVLSWGPCILGHAAPSVIKAIKAAADNGLSYGAPCERETLLAREIQTCMPHLEKIRFVNSGTEAAMSALRLARGYTKKNYIVKFKGCYHGHADPFLVEAGSGNLTLSKPNSEGVLKENTQFTLVCDYNDSEQLNAIFKEKGAEIAAVVLEPITGNMGVIKASEQFLEALENCRKKYNTLIIFDEVMCGFRCELGGASQLLKFKPDITILGKVIGGGLPCGAYAASRDIMSHIAPEGGIYQAGTLSGNPMAMTAGLETIKQLKQGAYEKSVNECKNLCLALKEILSNQFKVVQIGNMFSLFFSQKDIKNLNDVQHSRINEFPKFFHQLLDKGIYWPPSAFEACFMSSVHSKETTEKTIKEIKNLNL